jgi:hypothetical protein
MQRATPNGHRIRIFAAAFVAVIATAFVVPSIDASASSTSRVAHYCPPVC